MVKLLIVDDSNIMRKAIEKYLRRFSFQLVGTARNGREALELFRRHYPEFVTLDITMPELDGLACLTEMRAERPETRILVISALSDPLTGLEAVKRGASGFLSKPFTADVLAAEVEQILGLDAEHGGAQ